MGERDQGVGLAAAELSVEAKDRCHLIGPSQDAQGNQAQHALEALGRIGVGKEQPRQLVLVRRIATQYLGEIGGEVALADRPLQDVGPRPAYREKIVWHGSWNCRAWALMYQRNVFGNISIWVGLRTPGGRSENDAPVRGWRSLTRWRPPVEGIVARRMIPACEGAGGVAMNDAPNSLWRALIDWIGMVRVALGAALRSPIRDQGEGADTSPFRDPDFKGWLRGDPQLTMNPVSRCGDGATGFPAGRQAVRAIRFCRWISLLGRLAAHNNLPT